LTRGVDRPVHPTLGLSGAGSPLGCGLGSPLVFRRRPETAPAATSGKSSTSSSGSGRESVGPDSGDSAAKGRPTPKRRDAEAARKEALKTPSDPRTARKQARERDRLARAEARQALVSGDTRRLPARDAGPVRAFARDYIDSRRSVAEFFIPFAFGVIVLGFFKQPVLQAVLVLSWMLMFALLVVDSSIIGFRLRSKLGAQWPDKSERRGVLVYALMRSIQIRRMRLPPPRVKPGGAPVTPKSK